MPERDGSEDGRRHYYATTTTCGKEVLVKLSDLCCQRLVAAATSAAAGGGLWMILPPTPGARLLMAGEVVEAQYFIVSPCLNLAVVGPGHAWSTIPTTIRIGAPRCPDD